MRLETPYQLEEIARKSNCAASAATGGSDGGVINLAAMGNRGPELETISADKLAAMVLPPLKYTVQGYIAEGLTMLAGRPKVGKSWMLDGSWTILGAASEIRLSDGRSEILRTLRGTVEPMSPREIADVTGQPYDSVRKMITRMWKSGEVQKPKRGWYSAWDVGEPCHNGHNVTTA